MIYDIKIYDKRDYIETIEHETIRGLTYGQMLTITQVLTRYSIKHSTNHYFSEKDMAKIYRREA